MKSQASIIQIVFILVCFIAGTAFAVDNTMKPQITLTGHYQAISWVFSNLGERIDTVSDRSLSLVYADNKLMINDLPHEVDNAVHIAPLTRSDQYKAYWTDGGFQLVIEKYVSEDGTFQKDSSGNPRMSVSKFYFTPDKKNLIWETTYPGGWSLTRTYEKQHTAVKK